MGKCAFTDSMCISIVRVGITDIHVLCSVPFMMSDCQDSCVCICWQISLFDAPENLTSGCWLSRKCLLNIDKLYYLSIYCVLGIFFNNLQLFLYVIV